MRKLKKEARVYKPGKTIFELEIELKEKAKQLAKNHVDKKPVKYLLKK